MDTTKRINLDEPHFDEEATVLAARPVVPLDEVKTTQRSKGGLALALAIGGGLVIGLLAATLIFRYLSAGGLAPVETNTVAEQPAPVIEQPADPLPTSAGGAVVSVEEEKPVTNKDDGETQRDVEELKTVPTRDREPRATQVEPRTPVIVVRESRPQPNDDLDEEERRAIRRSERQEEKQERRRAAREARRQERQGAQPNDDLTRIREIFEGTPRP